MQPQPPRPPLSVRVFIGIHGLRAGWRFLLFAITVAILSASFNLAWDVLQRFLGIGTYTTSLVANWFGIAAALAAMWIMSLVEARPVGSYGFTAPHRAFNLASGLIAGFAALSALIGLLKLTGAIDLSAPALQGAEIARWGFYWAVVFAGVALSEESLVRSYALFSLTQGIGFWPAATLLSLLFGAGHIGNSGEEWIGIVNAVLVGMVFAFSVKWTGSLWWAIGCHMTWDWGESFFYGVADSGNRAHHHFLSGDPAGPAWLSGGTVGPEGSALAAIVILALAAAVRLTTPRWNNPDLARLRPVPNPQPIEDAQNPGGIAIA